MEVEYHPLTAGDLNAAIAHYNERRVGLGNALRAEVYATIRRIAENPNQFPVVEHFIRRCLVHRFPYSVLFRIVDSGTVRVLLVRHHRRHPRLGLGRR